MNVYRTTDSDPDLITMITKSSLLEFIQLLSFLIFDMVTMLTIHTQSIHFAFVNGIAVGIDLSSDFWCVILKYNRKFQSHIII